ncbi:MAG: anaerobic glycerol-3-phosphate dehydrogenase subunit C [Bacteroidales bacterium]|nr:anaerobic glycerol-3-phosphate dehydrogenase subunit C [Bacteroidales bacterium]
MKDHTFQDCVKCTVCTAYCPMAAVTPFYIGPKQAGPDGERYRLKDKSFYDYALKYCLNCKRCEVACPSGVRIGDIIAKAKLDSPSFKPGLREWVLANTDLMGSLAVPFSRALNPILGLDVSKKMMDGILGIDHRRQFPAYAKETFEHWYRRKAAKAQKRFSKQVYYYHGCYANYNNPALAQDLLKILNACGYGVQLLKGEKCCGVALISNGLGAQARRQAKANLAALRKADGPVLTTSSTCTMTLRDEYAHVLGLDNANVRDNITLALKFLSEKVDSGEIRLAFRSDYQKHIAYHTSCHMERLGWWIYSLNLLRMIPGVRLDVLESVCCGISGTFGFKKENYELSQEIGRKLFDQIRDAQPEIVATGCETCKWQIEMSIGFEVQNPVSILAEALDIEETTRLNAARP